MRGRAFLFDRADGMLRAAMTVDGRLEALEVDGGGGPRLGAVHRAKVEERVSGLGAAFLDLGGARGFMAEAKGIDPGDRLLVQVRREAEGTKAARVSADLQVEGRWMVHTPRKPGVNVSRKIADEDERERLRAAIPSDRGGFILRTQAEGAPADALRVEAKALSALDADGPPGLVREGPDAIARLLSRQPLRKASVEATPEAEAAARAALGPDGERLEVAPDPFDHHGVEDEIDALLSPRAVLPGGGTITLEPTTALVAVDVDSGDVRGGEALLRVNLAAAKEVARQLRLRRLGGAIAIDFAGGPRGKARQRLEQALTAAADADTRPLGWGPAGWFEMQRRRPGPSLAQLMADRG